MNERMRARETEKKGRVDEGSAHCCSKKRREM